MKLLYWTGIYWPEIGGIEVLALDTVTELQKRGYQIELIAIHGPKNMPDYMVQDGIPVHRLPFAHAVARKDLKAIFSIYQQIEAIKARFAPDVLHFNVQGYNAFHFVRSQKARRLPCLLVSHTDFTRFTTGQESIIRAALGSADFLAGVSQVTLEDALQLAPEMRERSRVIYNGATLPEMPTEPPQFGTLRLVCVGRLVREKGFDVAMEAFATLAAQFPRARLQIVGHGPESENLRLLTARLGLGDRVEFTGALDRAATLEIIGAASIVIVPSRYREPFALVALEAALLGRPVVASRWGGLIENVADGESGFLVEPENPRALAQAIVNLIQDPHRAQKMGAFGRHRARQLFSLEHCVDEYETVYRSLVSSQ